MSEKGNPLDRLTRPGGRPISDDESIPVLTERLTLPSLDLDISLPKPPPPVAAPSPLAPHLHLHPTAPPLRRHHHRHGPPAAATPVRPPLPTVAASAAPVAPAAPPVPTYTLSANIAPDVEAASEVDWEALEQTAAGVRVSRTAAGAGRRGRPHPARSAAASHRARRARHDRGVAPCVRGSTARNNRTRRVGRVGPRARAPLGERWPRRHVSATRP